LSISRKVFPELMALDSVSVIPLSKPVGLSYALRAELTVKMLLDDQHDLYKLGTGFSYKDTQKLLDAPLEEMPRLLGSEKEWESILAKWRLEGEPDPETYVGDR
jgi:hypothetical protein